MKRQELKDADARLTDMKNQPVATRPVGRKASSMRQRAGKIKYGCLAWLIGLPLPIVILLLFYKGCDF